MYAVEDIVVQWVKLPAEMLGTQIECQFDSFMPMCLLSSR